MRQVEKRTLGFVRALLAGDAAEMTPSGLFAIHNGQRRTTLPLAEVRLLVAQGVLDSDGTTCRATDGARSWLKRRLLAADPFASQHRTMVQRPDGVQLNLEESPLGRLASPGRGEVAFLAPHQVEAGERVRRLAERAHLQPRLTMNYSGAHRAGRGAASVTEIGDLASDARRRLAELHAVLPPDCAGVVLDVCGLLKGLQTVEQERGWPRRSAKLVLRIGLEQLAQHYGFAPLAVGVESRRRHAWLGEGARPERFG